MLAGAKSGYGNSRPDVHDYRGTGAARALTGRLRLAALIVVLLSVALLYRQTPTHFFYFDDFDFLSLPPPASIQDWVAPLNPFQSNILGWYRPIPTFYYFVILRALFGLDPALFMVTTLLTLLVNVLLVFLVVERVTKQSVIALMAAHFYGVNYIHFETLSWAAGFQEQSLALFALTTLATYLVWTQREPYNSHRSWVRLASVLAYLLALASKETAIILPAWLTLHFAAVHLGRMRWLVFFKKVIAAQWPYYAVSLVYLILRYSAITSRAGGSDTYAFQAGGTPLFRYIMFVRWIIDEFRLEDLFQAAKMIVAPNAHLGRLGLPALGLVVALCVVVAAAAPVCPALRRRLGSIGRGDFRAVLLGLSWFVVGLMPVALTTGQAAYYLVLPAVGAYLAMACVVGGILGTIMKRSAPVAVIVGLVLWAGTAWGAFDRVAALEDSDMPMLGRVAKQAIWALRDRYSSLPPDASVFLLDFPQKVWRGESAERSIQLYYGRQVRVVVGSSAEVMLPSRDPNVSVIKYADGKVLLSDGTVGR